MQVQIPLSTAIERQRTKMATNFGGGAILSRCTARARHFGGGIVSVKVILTWVAPMLLTCSISAAQTISVPSPPGRMVDMDGRKLHLNCSGKGNPTIVLEAGLGDSSLAWSLVQPKLATTTRVCSYDRSGTAWSHDAGPQHGLSKAADDLDRLLRISGELPPYLLVGHSWGGWLITVYTRRHPEHVAGIVLVDSSIGFDPPVIEKMPESQGGGPPTGALIMKKSSDDKADPFKKLPANSYQAYLWTESLPRLDDVDDPDEPLATVQAATSGKFPLDSKPLVLIAARHGRGGQRPSRAIGKAGHRRICCARSHGQSTSSLGARLTRVQPTMRDIAFVRGRGSALKSASDG
jgi:pimeloyl-ACP methyl ester carboxylesterase